MRKLIFALLLPLFLLFPKAAHAEVIHSFDSEVTAHKDGTMNVKETIDYDFEQVDHHGIFRDIPLYAKVGNLYRIYDISDVTVTRDGKSEKFSKSQDKENVSFKIGNPDKTMTGDHEYVISYKVANGIGSNFPDHDEIYWNATGNGWDTFIEKASASIDVDSGLLPTKVICYQGEYGSKDTSCLKGKNSAQSSGLLGFNEGLSIIAVYPEGSFPKSILSRTPPQTLSDKIFALFLRNLLLIFVLLNVFLPLGLLYWYEKHKNKERFGPPAVNFDIPKDKNGNRLAPALAGTIDSTKLTRDDITATLFDMAIRKYIKFSQTKTVKSLRPDKVDQTITKLKENNGELEDFESTLFDRLFESGDSVKVSDLRLDFYVTFTSMQSQVFSNLIKNGYYIKNPAAQKVILAILSIFALFTGNIILSAMLFFLSRRLNGRTALGDEADFKIDGLKLFLKSMDRNYKWQAEKFYTVEQMIPYAMALGYIDKFMEALKILKPDYNPTWYGGGNFYTNYAVFSAATTSNFTTSAPSSSSGSGGGGFSGGGGGGGGGGSW